MERPDLPRLDVAAARRWGAYPSPDPCTVAALLVLCGRRLVRDKRQRPAHARQHQAAEFTPADRTRLDWFLTRLRHHITKDGLHPRHVPALLPLPTGDDAPGRRPGQWLSLTRAATALHMLITQALDGDPTPEDSTAALGVTGIPTSLLIEGIHTGAGLRHQDADLLGPRVHHDHHGTRPDQVPRLASEPPVSGISREVLARDAAWRLADGSCKDLTIEWARWEGTYAASPTAAARQAALMEPAAVCAACPIATECANLAELSGYTGIAAGQGYRNGRVDHARQRQPRQRRTA